MQNDSILCVILRVLRLDSVLKFDANVRVYVDTLKYLKI